MTTNYVKGRRFEYRVRDRLYKDGAVYIMRAAQSKGPVDLLVLWPVEEFKTNNGITTVTSQRFPWLVQCKTGTARMTTADKEHLADIASRTGSVAVLAEPGPKNRGVTFTTLR